MRSKGSLKQAIQGVTEAGDSKGSLKQAIQGDTEAGDPMRHWSRLSREKLNQAIQGDIAAGNPRGEKGGMAKLRKIRNWICKTHFHHIYSTPKPGLVIRSFDFRANRSFFVHKWAIHSHCSFPLSNLSESLMVAHFWWAKWTIRSHRSFNLSEMRDSLTSLTKKEKMSKN